MGLTGDLSDFGLTELLQILSLGKKSGVLAVVGEAGSGELTLREGRLVHAHSGGRTGEQAFFELLANRKGRFSFTTIAAAEEVDAQQETITRNLETLLLESSQREI